MLLAATEVAANAVTHDGGVRDVRAGSAEGRFACDPLAGYLAPRPGSGSGLWVARQLTWQVEFFHTPHGFTAQILL